MIQEEITRKSLDNQEFLKLRQATDKVAQVLTRRLKSHLDVVKPLFIARRLFGTYIKSATMEEVAGSDKSFAELQERYAAICEKPFGLPRKLQPPLPPISNQLEANPFQYPLYCEGSEGKAIRITSPTRWIVSYRSECPLPRLEAMLSGTVTRQPEEMKQSVSDHLTFVLFLEHFPALRQLLEDLRYRIEIRRLPDFGGLPVVMVSAPPITFLPPDDFILQVTQFSGIPAFQEIIDLEALADIPDPLKDSLKELLG
jgi:hypothetical protein